ncbi:glycoside hydrolase, partial [Lachnotalea glycerini]
MTFNEINMITHIPFFGGGVMIREDEKANQITYQAAHHQLVASALATKLARTINEKMQVGCMLAAGSFYPYSCNPQDVWQAIEKNQDTYLFIDVQVRGKYPSYAQRIWNEKNVTLNMQKGDKEILQANTVDFIAFSYYSSRLTSVDLEFSNNIVDGNAIQTLRNPYLDITQWGRQIDPLGLRITMNELYDRYQ